VDVPDAHFFFEHEISHVGPVGINKPIRGGKADKNAHKLRYPVTMGQAFLEGVIEHPRVRRSSFLR
jgi:hypothetical protein